jgi:uncharacterized membrane protein
MAVGIASLRTAQQRSAPNVWVLWCLIATYAGADVLFLLAGLFPGHVPILLSLALHIFPPLVFALIHGARVYGWRGILTFAGLCVLVGNAFENLSILTGFPFGHYVFTDRMGPRILQVPILLGLAYVGMGYLSWTVARAIAGTGRRDLSGWRIVLLPLLASAVMTAWDGAMDPIWSTLGHLWTWKQGGGYFGVPASNYFGWLLTNYLIYQLFVLLVLRRRGNNSHKGARRERTGDDILVSYWRMAVIFYALMAVGNLLLGIPTPRHPVVTDAAGRAWHVSDITTACAIASTLLMGGFALGAWMRLDSSERGNGRIDAR